MFRSSNHSKGSQKNPNSSIRLGFNKGGIGTFMIKPISELTNSDNTVRSNFDSERDQAQVQAQIEPNGSSKPLVPDDPEIGCIGLDGGSNVKLDAQYKHTFPKKFKEFIIEQAMLYGIRETCKAHNISRRNVERWAKNGVERKKGCGRKTTNPELEDVMQEWVEDFISKEKKLPKRQYIIVRGSYYASESFKASKGWCDKFLKRNKDKFNKVLKEAISGGRRGR